MEFWGVEVVSGKPLKVDVEEGMVIHLSQACLGESKKAKDESVHLYVNIGDKKLAFGTLFADKIPQIQYDIVFDKSFELSHNWKNGSVFFAGYSTQNPLDDVDISGDEIDSDAESDDEEELLPLENGKPVPAKAAAPKPDGAAKAKVKIEEPAKDATADSDDSSSSDEDMSSDSDDSADGANAMDDDDSDEDSSDEDDEDTPTPKKADNKKRTKEPETRTPIPSKKAKLSTPQKTDGKKVAAHVDTPHPAKQAAKTPKTENAKTPASAAKVTCGTCSKTFNSDKALDSHSKAKHSAAK